ncbi:MULTISPECIES: hypothetical protein [unclassified Wenzhouxiangella]|uniref:hypothetical protein n=1 Tax=unclassified Wenzhouxiangella TaxID=2613841 RepID=UPI000E32CB75|nr:MULTISPECIES: hypothetical protein [unclassified Wenzhouxiangella]RFF27129.1 hypothetical protein DZK25_09105 [Wenzhouxiangella sp. 15181]RFP69185.1 hypothetical protein DZK26_05290 [Wenzhouxiangella sp. 15190]
MLVTNLLRFCLALIIACALAACQEQAPETTEDSPAEAVESEEVETDNGDNDSAEGKDMTEAKVDRMGLEEALQAARRDLAERSGVEADDIGIVKARAVTWRDGALGCPEEGMMYTQALVDGFYIVLSDGDDEHAYHAGRDGKPFFCPAKRSQPPMDDADDKADM